MRPLLVQPASCLKGEVRLLGDKSIAHRAVILSAITPDKTVIKNFPNNQDCFFTIEAFKKLGIKIIPLNKSGSAIAVFGKGLWGLKKSRSPIFLGESGTTFRLLVGLLAAQGFSSCLTADESLSRRPMLRVIRPLRMMGAKIKAKGKRQKAKVEEYPPVKIEGAALKGITYRMPVASAQVKSAILLAGLYAQGSTQIIEPVKTRDHSERMLKLFKAGLKLHQNKIVIKGNRELVSPKMIYIPADISSASFFVVLATLLPDSRLLIKDVSLNPSRLGLIKALKRMGAQIQVASRTSHIAGSEPIGDIIIKSSKLKGITVKKQEIPALIDELPILMVAASLACGRSLFKGIEELRAKETDRIRSMSQNLKAMGARISILRRSTRESMEIKGVPSLSGAKVKSFGDHRTAMSMVIAGLLAQSPTFIDDLNCINKSFPDFLALLKKLVR
ncbi:MAG: 3-phosphoshikimate 1-carboxyvinyltransferase [Omnitrophica WOR_2 bacterium RBG_13_41_10]|nr:MAG: 3-phosphoshikimate 1-carboxyvinyltransferase [Omnitrophica WOR_2 bacterium RBG_13_41_10]